MVVNPKYRAEKEEEEEEEKNRGQPSRRAAVVCSIWEGGDVQCAVHTHSRITSALIHPHPPAWPSFPGQPTNRLPPPPPNTPIDVNRQLETHSEEDDCMHTVCKVMVVAMGGCLLGCGVGEVQTLLLDKLLLPIAQIIIHFLLPRRSRNSS